MPRKTIMVVDDEEDILKLIEDVLGSEGYRIISAQSGSEALKKLKKTKPHLMIIDFFMPKMSGGELCERVRNDKRLKDVKILFLTIAKFSKSGLKKLEDMDVLDIIKKPFDVDDFRQRIKKLV